MCEKHSPERFIFPPSPLQTEDCLSFTCLSFMVNVCRGLVSPCLQFTEGCSQRHSKVHRIARSHLNAVFLISVFIWFPDWVNVAHKSMSKGSHHVWYVDFWKENLLNKKNLHWRKRRNVSEQYCLIKMNKSNECHISPFFYFLVDIYCCKADGS